MDQISQIAIFAIPIIIAITLHEAAHGYVARAFGDNTAADAGRVTLNPLKHIDPIGTVILPAMLLLLHTGFIFGYAKPVPVNFMALRHPKRDMIFVAAAGPAMNIALAAISALAIFIPFRLGYALAGWPLELLLASIEINLVLAVLNMLPIPPLDGSKVAVGLLPPALGAPLWRLQRYGILIVLLLLVVLPRFGLNVLQTLVIGPVEFIEQPILSWLGVS